MPADFHSHILPGMDDGSRSLEESVEMLRMEAAQGVSHVVATPHFYPGQENLERFLARREESVALLSKACSGDMPELSLGAEVYYFPGISESGELSQLTINGKTGILIEMPPPPWTRQMFRELAWIYAKQDLVPIIAHIDRYITPLMNFGISKRLEELPVLVQANAEFFLNRHTAAMAFRMLEKGQIHLLGSDCHNLTDRAPNLGAAAERIVRRLGPQQLEKIEAYQTAVLNSGKASFPL